jgi:hypothetical protein
VAKKPTYPHVQSIKDYPTQQSVKLLWDQHHANQGLIETLTTRLNGAMDTISNLQAVQATHQVQIRQALITSGGPLDAKLIQAGSGGGGGNPPPTPDPKPPEVPPDFGTPCAPSADHTDYVTQAKIDVQAGGNPLATECDIYAITQLVVSRIQASGEKMGFLIKTGGDNICSGHSISRVMYPDGSLWKILTDAGPGGANGPAWNFDGFLDVATRYDGPACNSM